MENIGEIIYNLLKKKGLERRVYEYRVCKAWKDIVGEGIARRVKAVYCRDGILYLYSTDSLMRSEIYNLRKEIIKKINNFFNRKIVKDLKFTFKREI